MKRQIFINLAVRDLKKSQEFFSKLGFEFNPRFTDDKAACMVVSEGACVVLLDETVLKTFMRHDLCDTARQTEAILSVSCGSRAEVDQTVMRAFAAGARPAMEPKEHGFVYRWSFYDLDGHHWEVLSMDSLESMAGH